jgi:hypothetical protein
MMQSLHAKSTSTGRRTTLLRKVIFGIATSAVLTLLPVIAMAQGSNAQPVDPPQQVAQLRQQFEGLTTQQIEAQGYVPEGPCIPNPQGPGAMGIHAINPELMQAQFPNGTMDPANPNILLVDGQSDKVIGLEWDTADVGQGPMKMFGQTIELQPGHPGAEQPHYMLHIYFKPDGKVLFGTNAQTAFDPEGVCPEIPETGGMVSPAQLGGILLALTLGGLAVLGVAFLRRQRLF